MRQRLQVLRRLFLYLAAELEAVVIKPGQDARWRERQIRFLGVKYGRPFYIGRGLWLHNGFNLSFGQRCSFGEFARIMDHEPIAIGDDFIAATGLQINSGSHDPVTMKPVSGGITIGDRVWCGANVTIVQGAAIGSDVVVGAGSVVRSPIPSNCLAAGVPASVIRKLERNEGEKLWTWVS